MTKPLGKTDSHLQEAVIRQQCELLRMTCAAAHLTKLAQEATRLHKSYLTFLSELLALEIEERDRRTIERRLRDAHFQFIKTLDEFDFVKAPHIPAALLRDLVANKYWQQPEPVIFIGESGTGKTHLATGLAIAACRQKQKVRFITAADLINELVEARNNNQLVKALARYARYDVIVLDEVGYVPLAEVGAELLFQVVSSRTEKATLIITTNLPFSEWTQVCPNPRLCKALVDRVTDRAHIIETGIESYRLKRTLEMKQKNQSLAKVVEDQQGRRKKRAD